MKFYQEYTIPDLGQGLDRFHSLDSIPDGQMFSLKNMDPSSNGQITTRKGFEQYYGVIPFRVKKLTKTGTEYAFEFDSATTIDVSSSPQGPLVVSGLLPADAGAHASDDFTTTFDTHYYGSFEVSFKETYAAGSPGTITKLASATGITQNHVFFGLASSDSNADLSNTLLIPEEIRIDKTTFAADLDYVSATDITGYFNYLEVPDQAGVVYSESFTGTTKTITGGTHNLNNGNFIIRCYATVGSDFVEVTPLEITSDSTTGSITVTFTSSDTYLIIVYAAPNFVADSAMAGLQEIDVTGVTDPFNFWEIWAVSGSTKTAVTPQSLSWDAPTNTMTIEYVGPSGTESVEIYWVAADYVANSVVVTGTDNGVDYSTTNPELVVWGIAHSGAYKTSAPQGGFTHHLDNYRSDTSDHIVTALGGNLFRADSYDDAGTTYFMASLDARGSNRVSGSQIIAPLFSPTNLSRTRGSIYDASVTSDFWATITGVAYAGTSGQVDYTFSFTSKTGTLALNTQITSSDYLTVRHCGRDINNGTHKIISVTDNGATEVVIRVANALITSTNWDEANINAQGNVFTDRLTVTETPIFSVGDDISSTNLDNKSVVATDYTSNYIYIDSVNAAETVSDGLNLYVSRTTSVIPLADGTTESVGSDATEMGFVIGDSVTITGLDNIPKIKYVNTNATATKTVTVASGVGSITLTDHNLNAGQKIVLVGADELTLSGEFTIDTGVDSDTIEFTTTASDGSYTNITLLGKTIEIDEEIDLVVGPTQISVTHQGRWTPVENPKSSADRANDTKVTHWDESDFTSQPYLRSVIVNDSMFFVNDTDEVKKYDGTNITNAGLAPFQGWAWISAETNAGGLAQGATISWDNSTSDPVTDGYFVVSSGILGLGDRIRSSNATYTVRYLDTQDSGEIFVYVEQAINASDNTATGTLTRLDIYSYYIRFNQIDTNRNIVASAVLGSDDLKIQLATASAVNIKAIGMPAFEEIDHDRVEIELYRTKKNTPGPFYRVSRKLVDYGSYNGYVLFQDTRPDNLLTQADLDIGITVQELGNQWSRPPLAQAITTVDNRLVLANIKSPPTFDIVFTGDSLSATDFADGYCTFRKSGTISTTTANNTYVFNFVNSGTTITPATDISIAVADSSHNWVDIDVTADAIYEVGHNLKTGMIVQVSNSGGALPTGLSAATDYYVIIIDADNYKLATSLVNATAGTGVSLTTGGGGTHTTTIQGNHIVLANATAAGAAAGDWIYLYHAALGDNNTLDFAGWYRIAETDTSARIIIQANHSRSLGLAGANDVDTFALRTGAVDPYGDTNLVVPVFIGTDGNFNQLYENDLDIVNRVATRLSVTLSAVMGTEPSGNVYWTGLGDRPAPWLLAQSGQSFPTGTLVVTRQDAPSDSFLFSHTNLSASTQVFVNNVLLASATTASSESRLFNSRLVVSYPGFPEIIDNPFGDPTKSDSIIDVNPADGQEINSVIPFFGQSAFGSANLSQVVVVLKTASIHLVDVVSGKTQKIQSQGQGCTAPRSVTVSKDGIMFANESGLYRLGWDMRVDWIGKPIKDLWNDELNKNQIAEFVGHNYRQNRQYKLGVVSTGSDYPTNVLVYDHTRENNITQEGVIGVGSWTEYTNHLVTGWTNQTKDSYFGNQSGQVMRIRNTGGLTDFRDDESAIANQELITGALGFGLPGNRKTVSAVTLQIQNPGTLTDVTVSTEQSLSGTFSASDQIDLTEDNQTIRYSLAERKGTFLRVKITKSGTKDEQFKLSKMTFHVKDIGSGGVKESADA